MEIAHPRVAGIDVHKKVIWVAVRLPGEAPGERKVTVKRFRTFWRQLQKMAAWLAELGVTDAAMESTGVYWWPVYHALSQAGIEVRAAPAACNHTAGEVAGAPPAPSSQIPGTEPVTPGFANLMWTHRRTATAPGRKTWAGGAEHPTGAIEPGTALGTDERAYLTVASSRWIQLG